MSDQLTTTSILSLFETTKEQRTTFVNDIVEKLVNEETNSLKVHLQIKAMEDIINSLTSRDEKKNKNFLAATTYQKLLLEAAEKYGKKFGLFNAEFSIKEVGTKYDFSNCEDLELIELTKQMEEISTKLKAKQDFLKTVPVSGMVITNEETGETYKVYPPAKSSTTSVAVTLK
jgi:hypothetical protein